MGDIRSNINRLPFIGGFTEALFGSPEQEEMQRQMAAATKAYQQYRPQIMQTGMNAFQNTGEAFAPVNNLIGDMYGQQYVPDMSKIVQNPFPASMRSGMYQDAFGGGQQAKTPVSTYAPGGDARNMNRPMPKANDRSADPRR
jgi:hypothetical protein